MAGTGTLVVTPGTGATINTLPPSGRDTAANSLPVVLASDQPSVPADTVVKATAVSRSGTITAGGTAQQLMPANTNRRGFAIQNQSSGDLFINGIGTASAAGDSLKIPAGAIYETPPHHAGTGALSIFGATTAQAFYAREF